MQSAFAAQISDAAFVRLKAEAVRHGAAFVSVNVAQLALGDAALDASGRRPARFEAARQRVRALHAELGAQAWPEGRWDNQLGQLGLYATPAALEQLRKTTQALSFSPDVSMDMKGLRLHRRFVALEAALNESDWVDAVILVRNELASYTISAQGLAIVQGELAAAQEHVRRGRAILGAMQPLEVADVAAAHAGLDAVAKAGSLSSMAMPLRIGRAALRRLASSPDVATVELRNAAQPQTPLIDPVLVKTAQSEGLADALLLMVDPLPHGQMSRSEFERQRAAMGAAMQDLEKQYGTSSWQWRLLPEVGVISARLSLKQVQQLQSALDPRLAGVVADVVVGEPAMNKSTARMRMPLVWNHDAPAYPNAGFRGAYPSVLNDPSSPHLPVYIVLMDAGTLNSHPMLSGRIADAYSSCFGRFSGLYASVCPGAMAGTPSTWNKTLTAGSAKPPLGSPYCADPGRLNSVSFCDHGTLVAGAAAGNSVVYGGAVLSGVAPAAQVVPVQLFSWDLRAVGGPGAFAAEVLTALQTALMATDPSPANNFMVINIGVSSPGNYYNAPCGSGNAPFSQPAENLLNAQFATVIGNLRTRGVPVTVPAGNNFRPNEVEWPACLPGAIKVGSVENPANTAQFTIYLDANRLHIESTPAFAGDFFFLAPGGGGAASTFVTSAAANPTPTYRAASGTSFAGPQVAGAYAVVRAGYAKLGLNANYSWLGATQYLKQGLTGVDVVGPSLPSDPAPLYRAIRFDAVTP